MTLGWILLADNVLGPCPSNNRNGQAARERHSRENERDPVPCDVSPFNARCLHSKSITVVTDL